MSTFAYAALTTKREQAKPGTSKKTSPPGVSSYVDALAALVPAEVLTLHALFLSVTTTTADKVTKITDPTTLQWAFWGLIVLSIVFYAAARWKKWDWLDIGRAAIPPLAFVGWTMLQRSTAFDAVAPNINNAPRTVLGLFLAALLGVVATALASKADQKPSP